MVFNPLLAASVEVPGSTEFCTHTNANFCSYSDIPLGAADSETIKLWSIGHPTVLAKKNSLYTIDSCL